MPIPTITINFKLQDTFGASDPGASIVVTLCNYGSVVPRIAGTSLLADIQITPAIAGDGSGSFTPWGNDVITPAGTFYMVQVKNTQGGVIQANTYQFNGSGTFDLSQLTPLNGNPTPPNPAPPNAVLTNPTGTQAILVFPLVVPQLGVGQSNLVSVATAPRNVNLPDASSTTVQPFSPVTNNFLTGISAQGVVTSAPGVLTSPAGTQAIVQPVGTSLNVNRFENIRFADQFSGADWAAKVNAADADLGAGKGEIWINQNAGTSATTAITLSDDHTLRFIQEGTYTTTQPITLGNRSAIIADNIFSTLISYTGAAYAIEINTVTQPTIQIGISIATTAIGAVRLRNTGNAAETRAKGKLYLTGTWTSGQIGVLLQADNANSANYHNKLEIYAANIAVPVRFVSLVNNQGPNGNWIYLESNGHTIACDMMDGTDNVVGGMILGCHGLTGGTAFRFGATGNGGYGVSNCVIGPFSSEQGGTSTTINIASGAGLTVGCGNSVAIGQSNDSTGITDANTTSTFAWLQNGGTLWHAIIADNMLAFGGARSAASAGIKRNGISMEARLGDDSAYTNFTASTLTSNTVTGNPPLIIASTTPVANLTVNRLGAVTSVNGNATTGNGVAGVVGTIDLTGQTAAIGTTNVNAGTLAAGQYLLTFNAKVTTAAGTSSTLGGVTVSYTDPDGVALTYTATGLAASGGTITTNAGNTTTSAIIGIPMPLNVKAGTNVTIAVAYASNPANAMTYNFHARLVAL